ncbi:hypothetical protein SXCC_02518 [Gluconacetobacter sp. SXCC-1]|uniref:hypothetical protein n=1 Tax=Komagataeibacter rhaeticus TaxID=215221 RepID=UPI0002080619|nr:hypothetical protein [Komagataeibacter rhaeticus]ATU72939.1 hypothetical protein CT154_08885 [Komagataeibacter xylinus]EGG77306.1 hypothetical protein SXCC_02518 [Gluconacetobacter sp. SXCC-1]WPP22742.1 hypothetical protein SCD25_04415 [Komagataeibacter rhaeticus]
MNRRRAPLPILPLPSLPVPALPMLVLLVPVLLVPGGCTDALMARNLPPQQDCTRRGGAWQVTDQGHTGLCRLPPGSRVAGWVVG